MREKVRNHAQHRTPVFIQRLKILGCLPVVGVAVSCNVQEAAWEKAEIMSLYVHKALLNSVHRFSRAPYGLQKFYKQFCTFMGVRQPLLLTHPSNHLKVDEPMNRGVDETGQFHVGHVGKVAGNSGNKARYSLLTNSNQSPL